MLFSLKTNETAGRDDPSFNIFKKYFKVLCETLNYLFNLSQEKSTLFYKQPVYKQLALGM